MIELATQKIQLLMTEIQRLRAKMIEAYTDYDTSYEDAIALSQELDLLIVEYHKLLAELNRKQQKNSNQG